MSLVNDMLRDLDQRKHRSARAERINKVFAPRRQPVQPKTSSVNIFMLAVASISLGLAGGFFLFQETRANNAPAEPTGIPAADYAAAAAAMQSGIDTGNSRTPVPAGDAAELALNESESTVLQSASPGLPAAAGLDSQAIAIGTISIMEENPVQDGFTLRISADQPLPFATLQRTATTFALRVDQVSGIASQQVSARGISVLQSDGAVVVEYSARDDTDFQLYEDAATPGFDLVLHGKARHPASVDHQTLTAVGSTSEAPHGNEAPWVQAGSAYSPDAGYYAIPGRVDLPAQQPEYWQEPKPVKTFPRTTPVRVARELPLEKRDARNSQQAIALVQGGQLTDACQSLLDFISANPEAHLSRETLATVLVAQNEYGQAETIIDEGLQLVPHYAPFKKIKARLQIHMGNPQSALELLRNLPPQVETDTEYFELLAMLYQQTGDNTLALATYQSLLRIDGSQGRWWAGMGISLEGLQRTADALASYQTASLAPGLDAGLRQFAMNKIRTLSTQQ